MLYKKSRQLTGNFAPDCGAVARTARPSADPWPGPVVILRVGSFPTLFLAASIDSIPFLNKAPQIGPRLAFRELRCSQRSRRGTLAFRPISLWGRDILTQDKGTWRLCWHALVLRILFSRPV